MTEEEHLPPNWGRWIEDASTLLREDEKRRLWELFRNLFALPLVLAEEAALRNYLWLVWSTSLSQSVSPRSALLEEPIQETLGTADLPQESPRFFLQRREEIMHKFAQRLMSLGLVRVPSDSALEEEKDVSQSVSRGVSLRFSPPLSSTSSCPLAIGSPAVARFLARDVEYWDRKPSRGRCLLDLDSSPDCLPPSWKN